MATNTFPIMIAGYGTKLAYTIPEACSAAGLGRTNIYALINAGRLKSFKAAGRRLILREDLETYLQSCRDAA